MSDTVSEKLSAFLDGELNGDEHRGVLNSMHADGDILTRFERYQLISDALRNNLPDVTLHGLVGRVSQALEHEPVVLAPRRRGWWAQPLAKQAVGMAVAATIATVAILSLHTSSPSNSVNGNLVATTRPAAIASVGLASAGATNKAKLVNETRDVQTRLSRFLVNRNEYSMASGVQGMMPYMRIVSYPLPSRMVNERR